MRLSHPWNREVGRVSSWCAAIAAVGAPLSARASVHVLRLQRHRASLRTCLRTRVHRHKVTLRALCNRTSYDIQYKVPEVLLDDGGELAVAWKPRGMSMRGGSGVRSPFETWAAESLSSTTDNVWAPGLPRAVPKHGRGVGGIVLVARSESAYKEANAALLCGEASLAYCAVVQGLLHDDGLPGEGAPTTVKVLRTSNGLEYGWLSLILLTPAAGFKLGAKELRHRLRAAGHPVMGNGEACALSAQVSGTYFAAVQLAWPGRGLSIALAPPLTFSALLSKDAMRLEGKVGSAAWSGRTEHVAGKAVFDGVELWVPPGVFVPRAGTAQVASAAASVPLPPIPHFLDLCTGSGALLVALLSRLPTAYGIGLDIQPAAVETANKNVQKLGLEGRGRVMQLNIEDIAQLVTDALAPFDLVVVNPPYAPAKGARSVQHSRSLASEPSAAFFAGDDGLDVYRSLEALLCLPGLLKPGAAVVTECPSRAEDKVAEIFLRNGRFSLQGSGPKFVTLSLQHSVQEEVIQVKTSR